MPTLLERNVRPELDAALADTPVVVLVGPRQCGKSTLADQIAGERDVRYVTLDDAGPRSAANADPTGFVEQSTLPLFIDEFQKAPPLLDAIKSRVDRARRGGESPAGMFLLTGSANVWATLKVAESLAGRAERVQLWPLSQGEIAGVRESFAGELLAGRIPTLSGAAVGRGAIAARLVAGGYPEMLARKPARRRRWARNYVDMVLERDVKDLAGQARQLDELPRLLELAAARVGGLVEVTSMGAAIEMKRDTTARYLRLLELLYLIRRAPAWSPNLGQRLIKASKLWFPDTGLACQLLGYDEQRFEADESSLAGSLFENFVAGEIGKQLSWSGRDTRLFHFRTAGGREVDLVLEDPDGSVAAVESKLTSTPRERDFSGLQFLRDRLGSRFRAGVVICTGAETLPFGDRLWAVPVSALWTTRGSAV